MNDQPALNQRQQQSLRRLARESMEHGLEHGKALPLTITDWPADLRQPGASFVTLYLHDRLRGCIGSTQARRPLAEDVAHNAYAAAFLDPRFAPCTAVEVAELALNLSILGPMTPLDFQSLDDLAGQLQPQIDGLLVELDRRQAVFLPQVWQQLPRPRDFLDQLLHKAGLPTRRELPGLKAWRYTVTHF